MIPPRGFTCRKVKPHCYPQCVRAKLQTCLLAQGGFANHRPEDLHVLQTLVWLVQRPSRAEQSPLGHVRVLSGGAPSCCNFISKSSHLLK